MAPRLLQNLRMADAELPRKETLPHLAVATIAIALFAFEFHAIAGPFSHYQGNVALPALAIALSGVHLRRNSSRLNGPSVSPHLRYSSFPFERKLLVDGKFAESEGMARECLAIGRYSVVLNPPE